MSTQTGQQSIKKAGLEPTLEEVLQTKKQSRGGTTPPETEGEPSQAKQSQRGRLGNEDIEALVLADDKCTARSNVDIPFQRPGNCSRANRARSVAQRKPSRAAVQFGQSHTQSGDLAMIRAGRRNGLAEGDAIVELISVVIKIARVLAQFDDVVVGPIE